MLGIDLEDSTASRQPRWPVRPARILHFHACDANATLEAEGLPYVFRAFEVIGAYVTIQAATSGVPWRVRDIVRVLLIVPAAMNWMPVLTPLAAAALALESLALAGLYARYSRRLTAANPLVWAGVMGVMAAFVAYGRYTLTA